MIYVLSMSAIIEIDLLPIYRSSCSKVRNFNVIRKMIIACYKYSVIQYIM